MAEIQKEFFDETGEKDKEKRSFLRPKERKKISFSSSFDTVLLGILILVMSAVIVYTVGVEVGRQRKRWVKDPSAPKRIQVPPKEARIAAKPITGKYTLQVASFTSKDAAQQSLERTKQGNPGTEVFLIGTQQFALCVGSYETRADADHALLEFRKQYRDAFVRNR